jgi:nuclear pore complex protein Nup205
VPTLISLIPTSIPLELKGAIFDTLRAFCEPGAGVTGVEICKAVWNALEDVEVLGPSSIQVGSIGRLGMTTGSGILHELDEIETPHQRYPSTASFVTLLRTLIHAPKAIPLSVRLLSYEPTLTIPDGLVSAKKFLVVSTNGKTSGFCSSPSRYTQLHEFCY